MRRRGHATQLNDIFATGNRGGLFLRISGINAEVEAFLARLYEEALRNGVIFEGRIPNPSEANLSYYYDALGQDFRPERSFIEDKLARWLPRMGQRQRADVAEALTDMLLRMSGEGKSEGILRNAYIRFMCWLYFKFERIAVHLGEDPLPKVLYQGVITNFELRFLSVLCESGCDVALIQPGGDANYLRLDPKGELSDAIALPGAAPFPANFSVGELYRSERNRQSERNPQGVRSRTAPAPALPQRSSSAFAPASTSPGAPGALRPIERPRQPAQAAQRATPAPVRPSPERPLNLPKADYVLRTNAWMDSSQIDSFESIATPHRARGGEPGQICNCFIRIDGAEDRLTYPSQLINLHQRIRESDRKLLILDGEIPQPTPEEIAKIRRGNYANSNAAIEHLAGNLRGLARTQLHATLMRAFMELLGEEAKKPGASVNRVVNSAVYLLCWFARYAPQLLGEWQPGALGCLISFNGCKSEREALFLRFLARTPVDVLVLNPNLDEVCALSDPLLFDQRFDESLALKRFPRESGDMHVRTAAAHAQEELIGTLYSDGFYRDRQFDLAQSVTLLTTYEEIALYWDQELKYRPNFNASGDSVTMPVLFAQASGIKDGKLDAYWREVRKLRTANCFFVKGLPFLKPEEANPFTSAAVDFFRGGKLQRERIRGHKQYPYALLREELQEHLLDKLQVLIDLKLIRGTFENGTEYQIIATALNLPREILRLIQQFDFTKKNPKLLCVHTGEAAASKQDAILLAYLNLVGFDVMCYVPTGYQCFGQWYASDPIQEHQLGDYVYDLRIPDFSAQSANPIRNLFKRGR